MAAAHRDFSKLGFTKTFVLPALLVFLVPILSFFFFLHAQDRYDTQARETIVQQVRNDPQLPPERREALIKLFTQVKFSQLLRDDEFAAQFGWQTRFDFGTFRWMIRLSVLSVVSGIFVFLLALACVGLSLWSRSAQYLSLLASWHVLRIFGALQTAIQGTLLFALSYWVTALWMERFSVKLVGLVGILAVIAVFLVIKAIFTTPNQDFVVEGAVLNPESAALLSQRLNEICSQVGTAPPDQIIAGIDDNFFVTEHPVVVDGQKYTGKTLFVSLPLLKQLNSSEADAILAHEMAHFSGQDTQYSKKISPLLQRYQLYLQSLYDGGISKPVFYFMQCFRALFELSLGKVSREREFRADRIAAETTSPKDCAAALLRTIAYSRFRGSVEVDLFKQQQVLETADVSARIESGFPAYGSAFAAESDIGSLETAHPFDSHPPISQRMSALELEFTGAEIQDLFSIPGDGGWYHKIVDAGDLERRQWEAYEERFRRHHEASLPYRYLPETAEEQAVVERTFPPRTFEGKEGELSIDFEKIRFTPWTDDVRYRDITECAVGDDGVLKITCLCPEKLVQKIKTGKFPKEQRQELLETFQQYYGRHLAAVEYHKQLKASQEMPAREGTSDDDDS